MEKNISFTLKVWRQNGPKAKGHFDSFEMKDIPTDTSFLEMLDILNEQLSKKVKNHLCSITIVEKVSAVCVHFTSMDTHTDQLQEQQLANYTCAVSMMET